ncbi:alpha/beta hydrolase [Limnobacter humi]|uniref:Alpha/beta hydrolase n=1 Tax=Limnobacter humi TaxID=1778671 RepID=A0ABT1WG97_9BURK|nr:alpha/beta hydrolase [Limnobacter humi]MCQ8896061.1 alpha/beta hydrolase [Limnobacter humi]
MNTIEWTEGFCQSTTTGLNMCWQSAGPQQADTILLVAGLGCQLTMWSDDFCRPLLALGYRLVRFDNRDIGLTDQHPSHIRVNIPATFVRNKLGLRTPSNYKLDLMADDAIGLIEALKLKRPHLVGISMGGMISQIVAAKRPDLIGRLVTLMSSTNHPKLPMPSPNVMLNMFLRKPRSTHIDDVAEHVERVFTAIGSPGYPPNPVDIRARARASYQRSYKPAGVLRQTHCVVSTGSIEDYTRQITVPTCVIHGLDDPLLKKECSERIAKLVPGARLHLIKGLGHDLPAPLAGTFSDIIHSHLA